MSSDTGFFRLSTAPALILSTAAVIGGTAWLASRGVALPNAIIVSFCGGIVLSGMLLLGVRKRLAELQRTLTLTPAWIVPLVACLWALFFFVSIGTHTANARALIGMALYLGVPFLLLANNRGLTRGTWLDLVAILCIWLPIELGLLRALLLPSTLNAHYVIAQGLAVNMGLIAFAAWRKLPGIGYEFELTGKMLTIALLSFLCFAIIAVPLGLKIHFIQYAFGLRKVIYAPAQFTGIFLFTAIPEELLFRGLIQNWLERMTGRPVIGLVIGSIVFGASHLNNGPPLPNYKYFFLASIAGLFYGFVWRRTRNLTASSVTHALVDTVWSVFFR